MKHTKRSINKAVERYVHFLRGAMDAVLTGKQLRLSRHYCMNPDGRVIQPCAIYYVPDQPTGSKPRVIWSVASVTGDNQDISPEDARLVVRKHFIDRGIPVEHLDRIENR